MRQLEWDLERRKLPKKIEENKLLAEKVKSFQNEFDIVNWYCSVMEGGVNTKEIVKELFDIRKSHKELTESTES